MINKKELSDFISFVKKKESQRPTIAGIGFEPIEGFFKSEYNIKQLVIWRNENRKFYRDTSITDKPKTIKWFKSLLKDDYRIIFILNNLKFHSMPFGMLGISSFNFNNSSCFLESIIRFNKDGPRDGMYMAINILCEWVFKNTKVKKIKVNCFLDIVNAVSLYHRCQFKPLDLIPLIGKKKIQGVHWVEANKGTKAKRYYLVMERINNA